MAVNAPAFIIISFIAMPTIIGGLGNCLVPLLWVGFILGSCPDRNKELKGRDKSKPERRFYVNTLQKRNGSESRQTKAPKFERRVYLSCPSPEGASLIDSVKSFD